MKLTVHKKLQKGFTLIELLVVIAVLGVLAAVVMVAINPGEQLSRGRDSGRKSAVGQLVNSMQSYYTANGATYPATSSTWINTLVTAGELKSVPTEVTGSIACGAGASHNKFCYYLTTVSGKDEAVIYTRLEAKSDNNRCASGSTANFLWNSETGQAGVFCGASGQPSGSTYGTYVSP